MGVCLRVLKEINKSRFHSCSVRNSVLIISHIAIRDCRMHIFSDNVSRNTCISKRIIRLSSQSSLLSCFPLLSFAKHGISKNKVVFVSHSAARFQRYFLRLITGRPVPSDVYKRLTDLELKVLRLEGLSPEYFTQNQVRYYCELYYMAESASGQDEMNPVFQLATLVGKMSLSSPSGISRASPARKSSLLVIYKSFIDQAYPVKTGHWARSFLLIVTIIAFVSFHKNAQKNFPIIISSHLDLTLGQQRIIHRTTM